MRLLIVFMGFAFLFIGFSVSFAGTECLCPFPITMQIDGNLDDWKAIKFEHVSSTQGILPAENDIDISFDFATAADDKWLYIVAVIRDNKVVFGETDDWRDDSFEIFIDPNYGRTEEYEDNDAQITIPAINIALKKFDTPKLSGYGGGSDTGTRAAVIRTSDGWFIEAAVPLKNKKWDIKPADGSFIGFNLQVNDDDDDGDREHIIIWSDLDIDGKSSLNTTRFGKLIFINKDTYSSAEQKN